MVYDYPYMYRLLKDMFIPHKGNRHRPRSLRTAALVGMSLMILLTFTIANVQSVIWVTSEWMVSTILPAVIVSETNEEREAEELTPLMRSAVLDDAARMKAEHMAEHQYFAHFSPEGVSPWYWFDTADYPFVHAGENLAIYFTDSSEIVDAWMDSPTHRANILNGEYQEIGIGIAQGEYEGYETVYVVQLFGTPAISGGTASAPVANGDTVATATLEEGASPAVAGISDQEPVQAAAPTMELEGGTVGLSLDHVSVSREGISRPAVEAGTYVQNEDLSWLSLATKPRTVLQVVYIAIGLFVFAALALSISADIRRRQTRDIVYGIGLIVVMFMLFQVHLAVSGGALIA